MLSPTKVKVMGHTYPIRRVANPHLQGTAVWGIFAPADEEIILTKKFKSTTKEADTYLHEIIHAINYNVNLLGMVESTDKFKLEEHITDTIANGLIAVFKDNPDTLDYLRYLLHGDDTTKKPQPIEG